MSIFDTITTAINALRKSTGRLAPITNCAELSGYDGAIDQARAVVSAFRQSQADGAEQVALPKGVIIHGEGCGSAVLAKAIAGELTAQLIELEISDSAEQRESLQRLQIKTVFDQALAAASRGAPVVLFIGGLDRLGEGSDSCYELTRQMDNLADNQGVLVVAEVSSLAQVDKSLLADQRFDIQIEVEKPDFAARQAIFSHSMLCRGYHRNVTMHVVAKTEADRLEEIERIAEECARRSKEFSAAEIYAALHAAVAIATIRSGDASAKLDVEVREDELYTAIRVVKTRKSTSN